VSAPVYGDALYQAGADTQVCPYVVVFIFTYDYIQTPLARLRIRTLRFIFRAS
jgi:hypothetical protein